jgi:hypothetical protein
MLNIIHRVHGVSFIIFGLGLANGVASLGSDVPQDGDIPGLNPLDSIQQETMVIPRKGLIGRVLYFFKCESGLSFGFQYEYMTEVIQPKILGVMNIRRF